LSKSEEFRSKAAQFARLEGQRGTATDVIRYRELRQAYTRLAENEEWLQRNIGKYYTSANPPPTSRS
jgi:hypothetical protein